MNTETLTYSSLTFSAKILPISLLKYEGYLETGKEKRGIINWKQDGATIAEINVYANLISDSPHIELNYFLDDRPINTRIELIPIPSNLGKGVTWKFICPYTRLPCFKLYECSGIFIHRSAIKGLYTSKNWNKSNRHILQNISNTYKLEEKAASLQKKYAKQFYKGKPTKKYLAVQKLIQKIEG